MFFYLGFAKEGANVFDMLVHFHILHHFPEGDVIAGVPLTDDSDLVADGHVTVN